MDLTSINGSYWTPSGTVFVGALCVVALFSALTIMMGIFARRAKIKRFPLRGVLYGLFCFFMILGLLAGLGSWYFEWGKSNDLVYWIECWILSWFGIGWTIAGFHVDAEEVPADP